MGQFAAKTPSTRKYLDDIRRIDQIEPGQYRINGKWTLHGEAGISSGVYELDVDHTNTIISYTRVGTKEETVVADMIEYNSDKVIIYVATNEYHNVNKFALTCYGGLEVGGKYVLRFGLQHIFGNIAYGKITWVKVL